MTNEAVCIEAPTKYARYKVDDLVTIPKGTLLMLSGADLFAIASSGASGNFAGIATMEKLASDGSTEISAALDGTWDLTNNIAPDIAIGKLVCLSGANLIRLATEADFPLGSVFGKLLEAAGTSEVVRVRVGGCL